MNTLKRYLAIFMTLTALATSMVIPAAHSYVYDWDIQTNSVYYEYDFGIDIKVNETIDNSIKKDVKLTNTGKSNVFAKAMIVFTPINKDGEVLTDKLVDMENDVTLELNQEALENGSWIAVNGTIADRNKAASGMSGTNFYPLVFIWNKALTPSENTQNLINSVKVNTEAYNVRVDIITDAIYEGEVQTWCDIYGLNWDSNAMTLTKKA
jgi:hypothetical protein